MKIEDYKNDWDNQFDPNLEIPNEIEQLKKVKPTLKKIKTTIIIESIFSFVMIILGAFIPSIKLLGPISIIVYYMLYIIICSSTLFLMYYYLKTYKYVNNTDISLRKNLSDFIYNFNIGIEMYRAAAFVLSPLAVMLGFISRKHALPDKIYSYFYEGKDNFQSIQFEIIALIVLSILSIFLINRYIKKLYGNHLIAMKQLLDHIN